MVNGIRAMHWRLLRKYKVWTPRYTHAMQLKVIDSKIMPLSDATELVRLMLTAVRECTVKEESSTCEKELWLKSMKLIVQFMDNLL